MRARAHTHAHKTHAQTVGGGKDSLSFEEMAAELSKMVRDTARASARTHIHTLVHSRAHTYTHIHT